MHTLYTGDRDFKNDINSAMRAAYGDDFEELVFPPAADQRIQLRVRWKSLKREQSAAELSDGTLRFLFLLTVLASPSLAPIIAIDEPETGLHPSMLPLVAEYAVEASKRSQIILTVGIRTVRFEGWPELCKDAPLKAKMHLNGPAKDEIIAIISLLDLYGPTFYPPDKTSSTQRYDWAKRHIESLVDQQKFYQFFAMHEVEAWLLSEPAIFPRPVQLAFPNKIDHPETVNSNEPPAKLLERLYASATGKSYKKVVNGKDLFSKLQPEIAYPKCPKLKALLDKMLELAKAI